jgi:hypothetical protein
LRLLLALGVGAVLGFGACGSRDGGAAGATVEPTDDGLPLPAARLLLVTDLEGYLEPCGCQSRPLGGIDKLATALAEARRGGVPTVFAHAGSLFFDGLATAGSLSDTQDRWKAETLASVLGRLGLDASTLGARDGAKGLEVLAALAARAPFPLVTGEAALGGERGAAGFVVRPAGGLRVGLVGVAEDGPAGAAPPGVARPAPDDRAAVAHASAAPEESDTLQQARARVAAARAAGADVVVVLASATRRTARAIAATAGADFVLLGGVSEEEVAVPAAVEGEGDTAGAVLLHAGRHGRGLLVVDLFPWGLAQAGGGTHPASGAWTDVGAWTRRVLRARLEMQIRELATRIEAWKRDPTARPEDVAVQRERLARLQAEHAAQLARPAPSGPAFAARLVELSPEVRDDPAVERLVAEYDRRVNEHNRVALANVLPKPPIEGQPHYVGVAQCVRCHAAAVAWWRGTPHGRAYATLEARHKQFNLNCVGCHVTGYERPGGSNVTHVEGLTDVQCEQCHGPGSAHVADPTTGLAHDRDVPEHVCVTCHNHEHSDKFDYRVYRRMLRAPGHGEPLAASAVAEPAR